MSNNRKALKSGIWYTASNFLVRSIGLITTPIFTRLLSKSDFGIYNNYSAWLVIITVLVTLNLESTLISARYDFKERFDEYIFSVLCLSSISVLCWFVIIHLFPSFFTNWWNLDIKYIDAMMLYLFFYPAVVLFQNRERYLFEYKKTIASSLFVSIGTAFLSVLLVSSLDNKLAGRIWGSVIPTCVLGFFLFCFFIVRGKSIKIKHWKYAIPICIPFIPHLLSLNMLNVMDKTMITKWCGATANAEYSLAYTCGSIVTLFATSLNGAYAPWLGEKLAEDNEEGYREIRAFSKIYIICFFVIALGIMMVAPEVLLILGGKKYMNAKYVLAPVAMGCVCQFLYTMLVSIEQFKKKTVGMAFASAIAALINYILNRIFIPSIGFLAAAYTTLVGYICLLLIHMFLVRRLRLDYVYDYKLIILVVVLGIAVMIIMLLLYSIDLVRYVVVVAYSIILLFIIIKNRKVMLSTIQSLLKNK